MARGSGKRIVVLLVFALVVGIELLFWIFFGWRDAARGLPPSSATSAWGTAVAVTSVGLVAFVAWLIFGRRARG